MDEMKAAIELRLATLRTEQAQAVEAFNGLQTAIVARNGAIHELQQLLSGFDEPAEAPTELPQREAA
jgi:hypothetical protein